MLTIYRASAGSGKTFRLTGDYISLLFSNPGNSLYKRILAVTFTNKATEEMKSRILLELSKMASGQDSAFRDEIKTKFNLSEEEINERASDMLISILHDYASFSISTIDSFFQQIVRAFARDIGIHGGYELELNSQKVLEQAIDDMFAELDRDENKLLLDWLTGYAEEKIEKSESWNLQKNIQGLGSEIFRESYQHKAESTNEKLHDRLFLKDYKSELIIIRKNFEKNMADIAHEAIKLIQNNGLDFSDFNGGSRSSMFQLQKVANGAVKLTDGFIKMAGDVKACYTAKTSPEKIQVIERLFIEGLKSKMQSLIDLTAGKEYRWYVTAGIILRNLNTLGILSDLAVQIKKLTADKQILLISDTNLLLNKIIDNSDTPFIYEKTGVFTDHFMIDEFQDTSVLQWKNFLPLIKNSMAEDKQNLLVGDVKQSIYRWRNSDWKLLDEQVYLDFQTDQIVSKALETNWRSDRNIIHFNNILFKHAAETLQEKLNILLEEAGTLSGNLLNTKITGAYRDIIQQTPEKAGSGCVVFNFIPKENPDENWEDISLRRLPAIMEDLQDRGYKPGDVAILVRENKDETLIINHLIQFKNTPEARKDVSYNIMSTKGLKLDSSPSVRFLLSLIHLLINPDDEINRLVAGYEYAMGKLHLPPETAIQQSVKTDSNKLSAVFSSEDEALIRSCSHLPVFEMTEKIIGSLDICSWYHDIIFIQAFQDMIFRFSTGKNSDLNSFIKWWEKNGENETIATPENDESFQILTIHKSKGLDFPVVIIPFCDWDLDSRKRNILWCETETMPFGKIPLIPVEYSSSLADSVFNDQYYNEVMHTYMDNINLAYVAFTRPRHELIVSLPLTVKDKKGNYPLSKLSHLIFHSIKSSEPALGASLDEVGNTFILGEFQQVANRALSKNNTEEIPLDYPVIDNPARLKVRHQHFHSTDDESGIINPLDYGILMHEILCNIQTLDEIEFQIQVFISQGRISSDEGYIIQGEIERFCENPEVKAWFKPELMVLNEKPIITPEGYIYRPDRIIIEGNKAIVIDYKFGEQELVKYEKQVRNYATLLRQMGYSSESWLYYVKLNKIVEVS